MASKPRKDAAPQAVAKTFEQERAQHFPADVVTAAKESQLDTGCPAVVTLAQYALESGYGAHVPADSNNFFGIKAAAGQPFVEAPTREWTHEGWVTITAKFRKFDTVRDAFDQHGRLLMDPHGPYAAAVATWNRSKDVFKFISVMAPVYATDRNYAKLLGELIDQWKLQALVV